MKRQKFVKQLISMGLDRNGAERCAAYCQANREPYTDGLARFRRVLRNVEEIMAAAAVQAFFPGQPIHPENLEGGNMLFVTQEEHARLHGAGGGQK